MVSSSNRGTGIRPGFPSERVVDLTYCDVGVSTSGTSSASKISYRLNSCFDPEYTGVGHQPAGFDQWATLYNHYVVESAEVVASCNCYAATTDTIAFGFIVSDDHTIGSDCMTLIENGSSYAINDTYNPSVQLLNKTSVGRFYGRKAIASDPDLRAAVGADPTEVVFGTLWAQDCARTTAIAFAYTITITYRVRFMEPKDVAPSMHMMPSLTLAKPAPPVAAQRKTDQDGIEWIKLPKV